VDDREVEGGGDTQRGVKRLDAKRGWERWRQEITTMFAEVLGGNSEDNGGGRD